MIWDMVRIGFFLVICLWLFFLVWGVIAMVAGMLIGIASWIYEKVKNLK